jgi:hypothetical protein
VSVLGCAAPGGTTGAGSPLTNSRCAHTLEHKVCSIEPPDSHHMKIDDPIDAEEERWKRLRVSVLAWAAFGARSLLLLAGKAASAADAVALPVEEVGEAMEGMESELVASMGEAAEVLEQGGSSISHEMAIVLISPLVLYKFLALLTGEKVSHLPSPATLACRHIALAGLVWRGGGPFLLF